MSQSKEFKQEIEFLRNKYTCPDLHIIPYDMSESQLLKRRFNDEELHFERFQELHKNELLVPPFYQDEMDLPLVGSKFIRSITDFYKGDLVLVTVEMGHWRLKSHDTRYKEYVTEHKNTVGFAFWKEKQRWALLKLEDWTKRKEELEQDLENPALKKAELEFYYLLEETAEVRKTYIIKLTKESLLDLLDKLSELEWYLENVPGLWSALKLYSSSMYNLLLDRIDNLYDNVLPEALSLVQEYESEVIDWKNHTILEQLENLIKPFLLQGYEVVEDTVYPNVRRIYSERIQTEKHANYETLRQYKEIARDLYYKNGQTDSFVWFDEVKSEHNKLY